MGDPYTDVTVSNYNLNPPPDDGSQVSSNEITWAKIKTKIGDALKTAVEAINTNVGSAVDKLAGSVTSSAVDYTVLSGDQGKLINITASGKTVTTPAAATVGSPFKFAIVNTSSGDITLDGNASETIDGALTVTIRAGGGAEVETNGSNWVTHGRNFDRTLIKPEGYLTLVSNTPVITSDQAAKTSVFYALDRGNLVPVSDGTSVSVIEFTELTLALASQHTANAIFDVFLFVDSNTLIIGTGPAWTTATAGAGARGTGAGTTELQRFKGMLTNKNSMTARNGASTYTVAANAGIYVGSIFIDGTNGQVTCHKSFGQSRKWGVWNYWNRKPIFLKGGDSTASWTYGTATIRASNNAAANNLTIFSGLAEENFDLSFTQQMTATDNAAATHQIYVGYNSTTAGSGLSGAFSASAVTNVSAARRSALAKHIAVPALGIQTITALEKGADADVSFFGGEENYLLLGSWLG